MNLKEAVERVEAELALKRLNVATLREAKGPGSKNKKWRAEQIQLDVEALELVLASLPK
jgi:hypothetical protein